MTKALERTSFPASLVAARERANAAWEALEDATDMRLCHTSKNCLGEVQWLNVKKAAFAAQDYFQAELDKWKANNGME